jgi:hypothetical protein
MIITSISEYFSACKEMLFEPANFFRRWFHSTTLSVALAFGLLTLWITSILTFLWDSVHEIFILGFLQEWMQQLFFQTDFANLLQSAVEDLPGRASYILLRPFISLVGICLSASVLFFFSRIFIEEESGPKVKYGDQIKILAFSSTGAWLLLIPFFGGLLSYVAILLLTIIGIRETYAVNSKRAALVVLLPQFLFFVLVLFLLVAVVILVFSLSLQDILSDPSLIADAPDGEDLDAFLRLVRLR